MSSAIAIAPAPAVELTPADLLPVLDTVADDQEWYAAYGPAWVEPMVVPQRA